MLHSTHLDNVPSVSNLLCLEKLIEKMVSQQLQRILEEIDYLDPFYQISDWDTLLRQATLADGLRWAQDGGGAFTNQHHLSPVFDTVDHRI